MQHKKFTHQRLAPGLFMRKIEFKTLNLLIISLAISFVNWIFYYSGYFPDLSPFYLFAFVFYNTLPFFIIAMTSPVIDFGELTLKKKKIDYSLVAQLIMLIIALILTLVYFFKINLNPYQDALLIRDLVVGEDGFLIEGRVVGYLSVFSTIIAFRYYLFRPSKIYIFLIPFLISLLSLLVSSGKGLFLINTSSSLILFFAINGLKARNLFYLAIIALPTIMIEFLKYGQTETSWFLDYLSLYTTAPISGFQSFVENDYHDVFYCAFPVINKMIDCVKFDSNTYFLPYFNRVANTYGSIGWIYYYFSWYGLVFYFFLYQLWILMMFKRFYNLCFPYVSLYCVIVSCGYSFFMNTFLFNGLFFILGIISLIDVFFVGKQTCKSI